MSAAQHLQRLAQGMKADSQAYARLLELLEDQFQAALRHESQTLTTLVAEITTLVDAIDQRRAQRGDLLGRLLDKHEQPTIKALLQRLPAATAQSMTVAWLSLEQQVRECKRLNLRNCHLITEQHALMQRVLGVEEPGYAER